MTAILDYLNRNSGAFNLLFSLVVAGATVFYAILTRRLVAETENMRRAQTEPALSVRVEPSEAWINLILLVVENIGPGPARDVKLTVSPEFHMDRGRRLSEVGIFRHGIRHLAPRQKVELYLTSIAGKLAEIEDPKGPFNFTITAIYKGATGTTYTDTFPIDFLHFVGITTIGSPPLPKIARTLEKVQESLGKIESGWRRIKVDVHTAADRQAEAASWEAQEASHMELANADEVDVRDLTDDAP